MKRLLIRLATWILKKLAAEVFVISPEILKMIPTALDFCQTVDYRKESGEWKRHQCYSSLIKKYPQMDKKDIALAIELAVRKLP